jgi:O-acetyl-ADP-ribose deacetylase (regulator of RNase III)
MRWQLHQGDILDIPADVLVCSANVYLTLSGGVGGAFHLRYGPAMQEALFNYLSDRGIRYVAQGDVIAMAPHGSPYRAVLHAVAVDGTYDSSLQVIARAIRTSLQRASEFSPQTIAMTALATGYGKQPMSSFAAALATVIGEEFPPIECVVIGLRHKSDIDDMLSVIPQLEVM